MSKRNLNPETIINTVVAVGETLVRNEDFKKFICGTYSDGSPRNLPDAINGEMYSPKQKKKMDKRIRKRRKAKKNRDKIFKKEW